MLNDMISAGPEFRKQKCSTVEVEPIITKFMKHEIRENHEMMRFTTVMKHEIHENDGDPKFVKFMEIAKCMNFVKNMTFMNMYEIHEIH